MLYTIFLLYRPSTNHGTAALLQIELNNVTMSDTSGPSIASDEVLVVTENCNERPKSGVYVYLAERFLVELLISSQRTQQNPTASSFLSLPAEIRNQIYEEVFQGQVFALRPNSNRKHGLETAIWSADIDPYQILERQSWPLEKQSSNGLDLLFTCRQIHAETQHLPFGLSTVLCGDCAFPGAWMRVLPSQLNHARSLQLCTYMPANIILSRVWLEILPLFTNTKKVEIHWQLHVPSWGSEEDHLSTAATDEIDMRKKITKATSSSCEVSFHRTDVWD